MNAALLFPIGSALHEELYRTAMRDAAVIMAKGLMIVARSMPGCRTQHEVLEARANEAAILR
jgi:hypothetical protein